MSKIGIIRLRIARLSSIALLVLISITVQMKASHAGQILPCKEEEGSCTLAIFPHLPFRQMEATYSSLAEDLSLITDRNVKFVTASTLETFGEKLRRAEYDIVLVGSPQHLNMAQKAGYRVMARRSSKIVFHIVTLSQNGITRLQDFRQFRAGRTNRNTATHMVFNYLVAQSGITAKNIRLQKEFGKQSACIHALMTYIVDTCTVAQPVLEQMQINFGHSRFRILSSSRAYPNALYLAHHELPLELLNQTTEYLSSRPGFTRGSSEDYLAFKHLISYQSLKP